MGGGGGGEVGGGGGGEMGTNYFLVLFVCCVHVSK